MNEKKIIYEKCNREMDPWGYGSVPCKKYFDTHIVKACCTKCGDEYYTTLFNQQQQNGLNDHVGEKVIIRTFSAGAWFGKLEKKCGKEVILSQARRMWRWWAKKSISLSGVAVYGINQEKSKICPPLSKQWLEAIEIITLSSNAIKSLEEAPDVEAE